jgi:radical SAM superfamily enzyme YgiQ (UPF0313 family)
MKVVLTAINAKFTHSNLAVRSLKAYTANMHYNSIIKEFSINDRKERIVEELLEEEPDIIGFSCYIWNIEYVTYIAKLIKSIDRKIEIIYGGPEVSYDAEYFLRNNPGEYLISGEGEETYREFIEYKLGEKQLEGIKGLYYKVANIQYSPGKAEVIEEKVCFNGKRELMDINKTVFAYDNTIELKNKVIYYEATRGCPFGCKYCLSSAHRGVRFLDINRVKSELKFFIENDIKLVKFVDRTFNCNGNYARELWSFLIEEKGSTVFHFEIAADLLRDEDIAVLARAPKGKFQFEIGVQSTNNETLKNINRQAEFNKIAEAVNRIKELGTIKQHLDLIAGLPGEDYNSFKKSFNDVYALGPEEIQLGFLKLLKGSPMRREAETWGITHSPFPPYEIIKSNDISYKELVILKRVEEIVDKYYNSQKFGTIIKFFLMHYKKPFDFYYELSQFFQKQGYFKRNISSVDYYKVFIDFNAEVIEGNELFLTEIIKYDYLKYNKKKYLPEFLHRVVHKEKVQNIKKSYERIHGRLDEGKVHIESFRVKVLAFRDEGIIIPGEHFYLFNDEDKDTVIDVTPSEGS